MKRYSLIFLLYLVATFLHANPYSDLIQKAGNAADYPGSDIVTIFDSTTVDVQESGLSYVDMHKLFKVLTPKGAKNNNIVKLGYDPLSAYIEIREVVVYRVDGTVEKIETEVLDYPAPARAIYWGAREKMVDVGRLEPGDAVEVKFFRKGFTYALLLDGGMSDDERYIPPMRGHYYDIVPFWSNQPILEKVYSVSLPDDKNLQFEVYNGELLVEEQNVDGRDIFTFMKTDILPVKSERNMVSKNDELCKLLLSTSPDWEAKSLWFFGVNDDFGSFVPTPEVKEFVDELLVGATTEVDSIAILTHWVADNMRYSGISMGEGEGFTLHNAEMNFRDRCGVCKDKASLLIAMLRAAGFESYAAMTMAGERIDLIPADQFNHSVTVVKLHNDEYMVLDPTWVPGVRELWSSAEQQQNYLMGVPEGATLMCTPVSPPENHYVRINGESKILKDGTLEGEFSITAEGQSDSNVRGVFKYSQRGEWKKNVEMELLKVDPRAEIIETTYTDNDKYLEQPVLITYKYRIPNFALVTDNEIIFTPILAKNIFKRAMAHLYINTTAEEKKFAFRDRCSRLVEINETVKLPSYKSVAFMPESAKVEGESVQFEGGYLLDGKKLILSEKAVFGKRIYETSDWSDFRTAVDAQNRLANEPIILNR